jgi:hypothetical protein
VEERTASHRTSLPGCGGRSSLFSKWEIQGDCRVSAVVSSASWTRRPPCWSCLAVVSTALLASVLTINKPLLLIVHNIALPGTLNVRQGPSKGAKSAVGFLAFLLTPRPGLLPNRVVACCFNICSPVGCKPAYRSSKSRQRCSSIVI